MSPRHLNATRNAGPAISRARRRSWRAPVAALYLGLLGALSGCYGTGVFTDGSSVSMGSFHRGQLRHGHRLPPTGEGYQVPILWQNRGNQYGTDEMVQAITRAARRVSREYPGGMLGVGDLSQRGGGDSRLHRSHENGRDADLIFYAVDGAGRPVPPVSSMPCYDRALCSHPARSTEGVKFGPVSPRHFDVPRNWALVRALLEDPYVQVQYLFCHNALKARLLEHAERMGEDPALVERAAELLHQPGDSLPHDDHLHLRIYCAADDRAFGCQDRGPLRWWKKRYKYMTPTRQDLTDLVAQLTVGAFPRRPTFVP